MVEIDQANNTPANSASAIGPLVEIDSTKRLTRTISANQGESESTSVEKGKAKKCQVEKDRADSTDTHQKG